MPIRRPPAVAAFLALALAGCASQPRTAALYAELGAQPGIDAIVASLVERIARNPRIAHHFESTDLENLRLRLSEQFCEVAGGPCVYGGEPMDLAHAGLGIRRDEFNALVEDLQEAMDANGVPFAAQNRLLALLAPMHRDVIGR
jgi:hemoglobin